jgi:hypothetical protein
MDIHGISEVDISSDIQPRQHWMVSTNKHSMAPVTSGTIGLHRLIEVHGTAWATP